ncbi:hypothetical protein D3Y57_11350 [Sphingomonas paeninsulae]|jgi:hypothetical protein|uniref:Uncharacterized protein n=2 Tax=Sphingomonas paeninsulae TaxID=2319844 RepID=A0A494THM6_SPHPE|nr:hypothetical protein D3Y57_11350 [Sphingomonas paeninsulae]
MLSAALSGHVLNRERVDSFHGRALERYAQLYVITDAMTDPKKMKPAKPAKSESSKSDRSNTRWVAAGAAMGIGSAALVAALLYSNRDKRDGKPIVNHDGPKPESD